MQTTTPRAETAGSVGPNQAIVPALHRGRGRRLILAILALLVLLQFPLGLLAADTASAHPLSTSAVLLDIGTDTVEGEIQLPIDRLAIALDEPLTADSVLQPAQLAELRQYVEDHTGATSSESTETWTVTISGGRVETLDSVDHLIFDLELIPVSGTVGDFVFSYDAIVEHLLSHQIFVSARAGNSGDYSSVGLLDWNDTAITVPASDYRPSLVDGFLSSIRLGFTHITEGADHLLFLLMLLLPAPLLAQGRRWVRSENLRRDVRRIVHVVTAFAIGHSITLVLGAVGLLEIPTRVVESLIALSIVVSGVHAVRPLIRGGETWIAAGFGLMHGLAFAALISELGLGQGSVVVDLLGFNIGIELTQLVVVALVMPSLLLLSRTRLYRFVRLTLAITGILLALGWLAERLTVTQTNPFDPIAAVLIEHPLVFPLVLGIVAIVGWMSPASRENGTLQTTMPTEQNASLLRD